MEPSRSPDRTPVRTPVRTGAAVLVGASLLALALGGIVQRASGSVERERAARESRFPRLDSPAGTRGPGPFDTPDPRPLRLVERTSSPPVTAPAPRSPQPPGDSIEEPWEACLELEALRELSACLELSMPPGGLSAGRLARLVYGDGRIDPRDRAVIAAAFWKVPPLELAGRVAAFEKVSGPLGDWWGEFFARKLERDPAWSAALAGTIDASALFGGRDEPLLQRFAEEAARRGDGRLLALLREGARGERGGTDEEVAAAILASSRLASDPGERLELLESILASPDFAPPGFTGGERRMDALLSTLLDMGGLPGSDPEQALSLVHRILDDPRLGSSAARHLLFLGDDCQFAQALPMAGRDALFEHARIVAPDAGN